MTIRLNGSTSGYVEIDAPAVAGNNTLLLPSGNGISRQAIIGDGTGSLNFAWDAGSLFYRLNAGVAGANVTTVQSLFGVGVTLTAATVYAFDAFFILQKSAGATTHNILLLFGGTASVNNILYNGFGTWVNSAGMPDNGNTGVQNLITPMSNSATVAVTASPNIATATVLATFRLSGTVSINAAGTFIPQYQLNAAPGGAYTTAPGSYIRLVPIGAAGSNSSQGTWA